MLENEKSENDSVKEAAKQLGRRGGLKGGKARAESLTPEQRREIAKKAVEARWVKRDAAEEQADASSQPKPSKATHAGVLNIMGLELPCYVLEDGRRILSQRGLVKALGISSGSATSGADRIAVFATQKALEPFISREKVALMGSDKFVLPRGGTHARGYDATILADICDAVLEARKAGALLPRQNHIADRCEVLVRGFARLGIVALVDEATGYQYDRPRDDLHRILELYIAKELLPWTKRFPDEFYEQLFRLKGWAFPPQSSKRPMIIGKLTEQLIYKRLPEGVLEELRNKNPVVYKGGSRRNRHHQLLTDEIGNPHLEKQVLAVTTLLRVARDWSEFVELFERSDPNSAHQGRLKLISDEET